MLYEKKLVVKRDVRIVYEGLFMSLVTYFENFIENLFIEYSCGNYVATKTCKHIILFDNKAIARNIISGGKNYLDWFPYDFTIKRAKVYFKGGYKFNELSKLEKSQIYELLLIRNFIAHKSQYSLKQYQEQVISGLNLLSDEELPADYLRTIYRANPKLTRFEYYISLVLSIANNLTK